MTHTKHLTHARLLLFVGSAILAILFFTIVALEVWSLIVPFLIVALIVNLHIDSKLSEFCCPQCKKQVYLASKSYKSATTGKCPHCGVKLV
jgi:predicted RNA-binding Zn-ribbon protein involved in translation (DUF1610 family)